MRISIYQAGPLFTEAEKDWHKKLTLHLERAGFSVVWPGALLSDSAIKAAGKDATALIYKTCKDAIDASTCVVALLDGTQVDDGTAWEMGYAHAKGLPIYGIRTDFRQGGDTKDHPVNSMLWGCLTAYADSVPALLKCLPTPTSV